MTTSQEVKPHVHWLRVFGRILALFWGVFWFLFGLLSALGEDLNLVETVIDVFVPGMVFLVTVIVAWRHEKGGGIALMLEGLAVAIVYPMIFRAMASSTVMFIFLAMALPPIVSGAFLVLDWKKFHILPTS